jgi:cytochrome o ubiquinol oxidase subunit 1
MPKNTGAGVVLGGLAFLLGFAVVWHIWWVVAACAVGMGIVIIARSCDDDADYCMSASDVERIEDQRYLALARSARTQAANDRILSNRPLPESPT